MKSVLLQGKNLSFRMNQFIQKPTQHFENVIFLDFEYSFSQHKEDKNNFTIQSVEPSEVGDIQIDPEIGKFDLTLQF